MADPGGSDWIRAFSRVVRLSVDSTSADFGDPEVSLVPFHGLSPILKSLQMFSIAPLTSQIINLVSTLPHLEDLAVTTIGEDEDTPVSRLSLTVPQPSPPFTGILDLSVYSGIGRMTRWLLGLPNDLHFRSLVFALNHEEDPRSMNALVEKCSGTVESFAITCYSAFVPFIRSTCYPQLSAEDTSPIHVDLSKATKLAKAIFLLPSMNAKCITLALQTITRKHRNLRQISIHVPHETLADIEATRAVGEQIRGQWSDLDYLLAHFWDSRSIRPKISCNAPRGGRGKVNECVRRLLPEITRREIIDFTEWGGYW